MMASIVAFEAAFTIRQFTFVDAWLTAKLIGLLLYVGLGFVALRNGMSKTIRFLHGWLQNQHLHTSCL